MMSRLTLLTMPAVTVLSKPNGLPMAMTVSPARVASFRHVFPAGRRRLRRMHDDDAHYRILHSGDDGGDHPGWLVGPGNGRHGRGLKTRSKDHDGGKTDKPGHGSISCVAERRS